MTFTVQVLFIFPSVVEAVIVQVPTFIVLITPLSTVATDSFEELHFKVLYVAFSGNNLAVIFITESLFTSKVCLLSCISVTSTGFTVILHVAETLLPATVAVTVVSPGETAVTFPLFTVAILLSPTSHLMFCSVVFSGITVYNRSKDSPTRRVFSVSDSFTSVASTFVTTTMHSSC